MERPSRESQTTAMPTVPEGLKNNVRAVLLSQTGGVLLTKFERDYRELVKLPLKYKALGFETLEGFIRSIPDAARMEYSSRDGTMRIFGISKPEAYMNKVMKKAQGRIPLSHLKEIQNHDRDQNGLSQGKICENTSINGTPVLSGTKHMAGSGRSKQKINVNSEPEDEYEALEPDERGWYTICFPEERVPQGEDHHKMFAEAGPLMAIHQAAGLMFVRYNNPDAARTALDMFHHLGPRIGRNRRKGTGFGKRQHISTDHLETSSINSGDDSSGKFMANGESRVREPHQFLGKNVQDNKTLSKPPPLEGGMLTSTTKHQQGVCAGDDHYCTELFIGNIPNDRECTKEKVRELFSEYRLAHLYWKRSRRKTFAFALLHSQQEAEDAQKKLNGYELMGRRLRIRISEHKITAQVGTRKAPENPFPPRVHKKMSLFDHITDYGVLPDLEQELPGLEEDDPSDEDSDVEVLVMRKREHIVPNPVITRQVVAFGEDSQLALKITRQVSSTPTEQGDFGSEVARRIELGFTSPGSFGSEVARRMELGFTSPGSFASEVARRMDPGFAMGVDKKSTVSQKAEFNHFAATINVNNIGGSMHKGIKAQMNEEDDIGDEQPQILVANFRKGTSMEELRALFFRYKPQRVQIIPSQKCTKAVINLEKVGDVKAAVAEMNQQMYNGQVLLVDVPFQCPKLRVAVLGPAAAEPHKPKDKEEKLTASALLKERAKVLGLLKSKEPKVLLGQRVEVLVASALTDSFFWGQIVDEETMYRLKEISTEINSEASDQLDRPSAAGPCKAIFDADGLWYRAWLIASTGPKVQVFYLDYGNTATIPWSHTAKATDPELWNLRPMAIPFMLTDKVVNLKERELMNITVEIAAQGAPEEGSYLVAKPISLLGNWQALINAEAILA